MQEITTTPGLIATISDLTSKKLKANTLLGVLEEELRESDLMQRINKGKDYIKELEVKEIEIRNTGIKILQKAGIDKFESNGVEVRIKTSLGKVVIKEEGLIPEEFKKTTIKTTTSIDKKSLGKAIKEGEIIDGVILQKDVSLEIKYK